MALIEIENGPSKFRDTVFFDGSELCMSTAIANVTNVNSLNFCVFLSTPDAAGATLLFFTYYIMLDSGSKHWRRGCSVIAASSMQVSAVASYCLPV